MSIIHLSILSCCTYALTVGKAEPSKPCDGHIRTSFFQPEISCSLTSSLFLAISWKLRLAQLVWQWEPQENPSHLIPGVVAYMDWNAVVETSVQPGPRCHCAIITYTATRAVNVHFAPVVCSTTALGEHDTPYCRGRANAPGKVNRRDTIVTRHPRQRKFIS